MSARDANGSVQKADGAAARAPVAERAGKPVKNTAADLDNPLADSLDNPPDDSSSGSLLDGSRNAPSGSSSAALLTGSSDDSHAGPLAGAPRDCTDNAHARDAHAPRDGNTPRGRQNVQPSSSRSSSQPLFGAFVQKAGRGGFAHDSTPHDADGAPSATAVKAAKATKPAATADRHDLHAVGPAQWPDDAVEVGAVVDAYGLKGWVKVSAHAQTGPGANQGGALLAAKRWWLTKGHERWSVACVSARVHGESIVAQLGGVGERDAALRLRGCGVHVRRDAFPALADDEFYWVDLLGLDVLNEAGVALGQVAGMIDNGAHSVLRIAYPSTGKDGRPATGERLIPFVGVYVKTVDLAARRIVVEWEADY